MKRIKHLLVLPVLAVAVSMGLLTACSGSESGSSSPEPPSSPDTSTTQSDADNADVVANPPSKSMQDALSSAQEEFSGDISKIELEQEEGTGLEYKIELISSDTKYAVQFDADTLEKISEKKDELRDDAAEKRKKTFDLDSVIDLEEATEAARNQQEDTITEWKIEGKDNGLVQYEFDIRPDAASDDTEVQINAKDGSIIDD